MAIPQSPFSFLGGLFERVAVGPQPPQWLVHEVQQRIVLFLNHVLMQEREAMDRLVRQKGRVARAQWRGYSMSLLITPAGLLNLAPEGAAPDLQIEVTQTSPFSLAQGVLRGEKPAIRIEGDVQLAADINWLVDNVRWDVEEDLARVVGDTPAHTVSQVVRRVVQALRQFVGQRTGASSAQAGAGSELAPVWVAPPAGTGAGGGPAGGGDAGGGYPYSPGSGSDGHRA